MHRILAEGFVLLVLASAAEAGTFYVATDGKPTNDGSRDKPWPSVEFALQKVGSGNTIVVRPGIYRGPITVARAYAGTKSTPPWFGQKRNGRRPWSARQDTAGWLSRIIATG